MDNKNSEKIEHVLVTGAGGTVGGLVVPELRERGLRVRALTRDPSRRTFPAGVEVAAGDLADPATLDGVFDGVDAVFLFPVAETAAAVVDLMRRAGVRRVVVLSSTSVSDGDDTDFGYRHHRPVEEAVERSGLEWTHLRAGEFMANDLDSYSGSVRAEGVVRAPHGDRPWAPVHEADLADAAVAALTGSGHHGKAYTLTGPETVTAAERAAAIGAALGREVRFVHLSNEEARELWISQGVPPEVCDWLLWEAPDGWDPSGLVSSDYEKITGRRGRTYAQWADDHRADFS
ncbi:NAD(P)H-binding protein [Nocardiopsis changdeensis]|uniref:NAD(P)H-binding protein n=1 Tax=Nocardiopsis changdeensis TaxID=2831969 RepID=UPI003F4659B9